MSDKRLAAIEAQLSASRRARWTMDYPVGSDDVRWLIDRVNAAEARLAQEHADCVRILAEVLPDEAARVQFAHQACWLMVHKTRALMAQQEGNRE